MPGDSGYTTAELSSLTMDLGTVTPPQLGSRVNAYGMVLPSGGFALAGLEILSSVTPPPGISSIAPSTATYRFETSLRSQDHDHPHWPTAAL